MSESEEIKTIKQGDGNCRVYFYDKPKETNSDTMPTLTAVGFDLDHNLFIFDLYSPRFLDGIHRMDLFFGLIMKSASMNPAVALARNVSRDAEIKKRKKQIDQIVHSGILYSELKSKNAYKSGEKVNRILALEQKKHKILVTYTQFIDGIEKKFTIPIYDTINDYDALVRDLYDYKKKSENICPYCGSFMENGYCTNCAGKRPVTEDPEKARKRKNSLIAYTVIAVVSIIIMLIIPSKAGFIVPKVIFVVLSVAFTVAAVSVLGEIMKEKKERVE